MDYPPQIKTKHFIFLENFTGSKKRNKVFKLKSEKNIYFFVSNFYAGYNFSSVQIFFIYLPYPSFLLLQGMKKTKNAKAERDFANAA